MSRSLSFASILAAAAVVAAGPCDIYGRAGTPCVAAHATTRALYDAYQGPLYQVKRADGKVMDIKPRVPGGVANAATQDTFCAKTTCRISILYDQSGRNNHLTGAPGGHAAPKADLLADATAAPVKVNGHRAYGIFIAPKTGYRNDATNGIATGDAPEGIYNVVDGFHYNDKCCFDYGNAETSNTDQGPGTMETVYFGAAGTKGHTTGNGPWVKVDMEDGLYPSINASHPSPSISHRFVHSIVKGKPNFYAIRGGDATAHGLSTFYSGVRPAGYTKMNKKGAIVLGVGGDNSNRGQGTFYEGAMTSGYPTDATEASVQDDIVGIKYTVS